jgi:DNA-binding transcriptional LysR family regulator
LYRQALEHVLREKNLISKLQIAAEVDTLDLMVAAVKAGFGIALTPFDPRMRADLGGLVRIKPPPRLPNVEAAVICKEGVYLPRYMQAFIEIVTRTLSFEPPLAHERPRARRQRTSARVDE